MNFVYRLASLLKQLWLSVIGEPTLEEVPAHLTIPENCLAQLHALRVTSVSYEFRKSLGFPVQRTTWDIASVESFAHPAMLALSIGRLTITLRPKGQYLVRADDSFLQMTQEDYTKVMQALLATAELTVRISSPRQATA